jgi:hypothetical protein
MPPTTMQVAELRKITFRETPEYRRCAGPVRIHRSGISECKGCAGPPRADRYHGPYHPPRVVLCQAITDCARCQ